MDPALPKPQCGHPICLRRWEAKLVRLQQGSNEPIDDLPYCNAVDPNAGDHGDDDEAYAVDSNADYKLTKQELAAADDQNLGQGRRDTADSYVPGGDENAGRRDTADSYAPGDDYGQHPGLVERRDTYDDDFAAERRDTDESYGPGGAGDDRRYTQDSYSPALRAVAPSAGGHTTDSSQADRQLLHEQQVPSYEEAAAAAAENRRESTSKDSGVYRTTGAEDNRGSVELQSTAGRKRTGSFLEQINPFATRRYSNYAPVGAGGMANPYDTPRSGVTHQQRRRSSAVSGRAIMVRDPKTPPPRHYRDAYANANNKHMHYLYEDRSDLGSVPEDDDMPRQGRRVSTAPTAAPHSPRSVYSGRSGAGTDEEQGFQHPGSPVHHLEDDYFEHHPDQRHRESVETVDFFNVAPPTSEAARSALGTQGAEPVGAGTGEYDPNYDPRFKVKEDEEVVGPGQDARDLSLHDLDQVPQEAAPAQPPAMMPRALKEKTGHYGIAPTNELPKAYFQGNHHLRVADGTTLFRTLVIIHWTMGAWYYYFRVTETINPNAAWFSAVFLVAELWFFFTSFGFFTTMWRRVIRDVANLREMHPPFPEPQWPSVDVFLCCYSEPEEVVEKTLRAILNLDYPEEKLHIYICDDGGSSVIRDMAQRVISEGVTVPYTIKRREKIYNPAKYSRIDAALGSVTYEYRTAGRPTITWIARKKAPVHYAKAGNLNNAVFNENSKGEYLLFFDADMCPEERLLQRVLTHFYDWNPSTGRYESNNIAFVQTPQVFTNVEEGDPFGNNNAIFYGPMIQGRDGFNAVPFVGTNALCRRLPFEQIGGYPTKSVTEDVYMSMRLQADKWSAAYHSENLVWGLAPDDTDSVFSQRMRWAIGAVQILLNENPLKRRGLTLIQKYLYFDAAIYPLSSIFTVIFMFVPIYFCLSGEPPMLFANSTKFILLFVPYFVTGRLALIFATRDVDKQNVWREQQLQFGFAVIYLLALTQVLTGKKISFAVTRKDGVKTRSPLVKPLMVIHYTVILGMVIATFRFFWRDSIFKGSSYAPLMAAPWVYFAAMCFSSAILTHLSNIIKKAREESQGGGISKYWMHNSYVVLSVAMIALWQEYQL